MGTIQISETEVDRGILEYASEVYLEVLAEPMPIATQQFAYYGTSP